jgi:hypothetical protein
MRKFKFFRGTDDHPYTDDRTLIGTRGRTFIDTGLIYAPYIPMTLTPVITNTVTPVTTNSGFYFKFNDNDPILLGNGTAPLSISLNNNTNGNITFTDNLNTFSIYYNG